MGSPEADENDDEDRQGSEEPLSFRLSKRAEEMAIQAEDVRRLYVAATRHRDHLIFVGADRRSKDGRFKDSGCYLSALDGVFRIADAIDTGAEQIEYGEGFAARLARVEPAPSAGGKRKVPPILRFISTGASAGQVADALADMGRGGEAAELNRGPQKTNPDISGFGGPTCRSDAGLRCRRSRGCDGAGGLRSLPDVLPLAA